MPNWYKPIHPGTLQCGSGVAAESPNRIYVVTEVEVPAGHNSACTPERYKSGAHSHNILVLNEKGEVIEDWKQWDNLFGTAIRSASTPTIRRTSGSSTGTCIRSTRCRVTASNSS